MPRKKKDSGLVAGKAPAKAPAAASESPAAAPAAEIRFGADASRETTRVRVLAANASPVPVHVHGIGTVSLAVDPMRAHPPQEVPVEALDALRNSDVTFEEID